MSSSNMRFVKEFTRPDFLAKNSRSQQISSLFLFYERVENDLRGLWMTPYLENYVQRQTENSARECVLHLKVFEAITCLAFITLPPIINQRLCPWGSNPKTDHALQADSQWDSGALCTEGASTRLEGKAQISSHPRDNENIQLPVKYLHKNLPCCTHLNHRVKENDFSQKSVWNDFSMAGYH